MSPTVLLMLKAPEAGAVKTRLAREIGEAAAVAAYRRLVEHQLRQIPMGWRVRICYAPDGAAEAMREWLGPEREYSAQGDGDLGERLSRAMRMHFGQSAGPLIFIGGDCPYLDEACFRRVAEVLQEADVALVPAMDGGYCLIGMRRGNARVFEEIRWSTRDVLTLTRERLREVGLTSRELEPLEDVDDLASWQRACAAFPDLAAERRRPCAVLVGAGHAHLYALRRARAFVGRGFDLVVIVPENFWYSGMATGVLGGKYRPEEDQIDVEALVRRAGKGGGKGMGAEKLGRAEAKFVRGTVVQIDPEAGLLRLESGATFAYDVLSLNIGSEVRALPGETVGVFPIKPLRKLWELHEQLAAARNAGRRPRVVVAGAGASGCEIAANVRVLLGRDGGEVVLLSRAARILSEWTEGAARALERHLLARGIEIRANADVTRIEGKTVVTEAGERIAFDYLVNATGLLAPGLIAESGLPSSERGELLVDQFLRSTGDASVFGGGDCVKMSGRELEKNGVYAVREAPVLFRNLIASLESAPLREYEPQRDCLLILNLGDGLGLARWRRFHWLGRAALWVKDRIDRAFLARYRAG